MTGPGGDEVTRVSVRVVPNTDDFKRDLERQLRKIRDTEIKIPVKLDLDKADLERQLNELRFDEVKIPVGFDLENIQDDINRATRDARADEIKVPVEVDRDTLDESLAEVARDVDPVEIPVELDEDRMRAELARINEQIDYLSSRTATPNVELLLTSFEAQRREVEQTLDRLRRERVDIPVDVDGGPEALAEITSIREAAEALGRDPVLLRFELNQAQLEREIAEVEARIAVLDDQVATPEVRLETTAARRELDLLNRELDELDGRRAEYVVDMDVNTAQAAAELALFRQRQEANKINLEVDVDRDTLARTGFAITGALGSAFTGLGSAISSIVGAATAPVRGFFSDLSDSVQQVSRSTLRVVGQVAMIGAMTTVAAIAGAGLAAAWGAVATALATIPAAVALLGAPIAAIALGMDGIKKAASTLKPEFDALKASVSATFERGLTPVFERLSKLFPTLTEGLNSVATGLSNSAAMMSLFLTSSTGMTLIAGMFRNVRQAIEEMTPGLVDITSGFLELANHKGAFDALTGAVNTFGARFRENVTDTVKDGTLTRAFKGLQGMLQELAIGFADLVENGIEVFAAAAPGVNSFLRELTGFFNRFNWTTLGTAVGRVFEGLGETLRDVPTETIRDIEDAFSQMGDTFKDPEFQDGLRNMISGIPAALRQLDELSRAFVEISSGIADAIKGLDEADRKFKEFLDWFNSTAESENGKGILTADASWWQSLMDSWDGWIERIKQNWQDFVDWWAGRDVPDTQNMSMGTDSGDGGIGQGIIDGLLTGIRSGLGLFARLMTQLALAGINAAKSALGISSPSTVFIAIGEDITAGLAQGIESGTGRVLAAITALSSALAGAFNFTGFGEAFGLAFQRMVGTAVLGMAAIAATVTDGMALVRAAFNFSDIGIGLGLAFQGMIGTVNLGMDSIILAIQAKMPLITAAFNFTGVSTALGLAFLQMLGTVNLGMDSIILAIQTKMIAVSAAFNFTNIGTTLGLAFLGMVGTVNLGMDSIIAAIQTKMVLVRAAFDFTGIGQSVGLAFLAMVGTVNLGMASIVVAVEAGMARVRAAVAAGIAGMVPPWVAGWAQMIAAVIGAIAGIAGAVTGGMATVRATIQGAITGIVGFWRQNWQLIVGAVRQANADLNGAVSGGMAVLQGLIRGGLSGAVSAARGFIPQFSSVGSALMMGLRSGILGAAGTIAAAAADVVRRALAAARAAGIVSSPSKAFMEIGGYFGEGLALGMEKSVPRVEAAADKMASAAVDSADRIGSAFSGSVLSGGLATKVEHSFGELAAQTSDADVVGQLRALNGNVDQSAYFATLIAEVRALRQAVTSGSATGVAATARTAAALGAF